MALWSSSSAAQTVLDREALLAHGLEIASFKPADAFADVPDESGLNGRPFRLSQPLLASEEASLTHIIGGWSYDRRTQVLRVGIATSGWQPRQIPEAQADQSMHRGLRVGTRTVSDQTVMAQNAYGAQFEVQSIEAEAIQISPLTTQERVASVDIPTNMFVDIPMPPDEARASVSGAEVVVEGILATVEPGRMTYCFDVASEATIDRRLSSLIHTCVMNARITRVAVLTADGRVLTEWAGPTRQ